MGNSESYSTGRWTEKEPLAIARSHCPTAVHSGMIYGFGGGGPNFKSLNSVVVYDSRTETWSRRADMPTLRSGAVATTIGDAIYVIGGGFKQDNGTFRFLRTTEIYHPDRDTWETGPDMLMPHDFPAGTRLGNFIYIMGGHHPDAVVSGPQTDPGFAYCERLNLTTGVWEKIAPLPTPRFALTGVPLDGKIVTMGGVAFRPEGFNNFDHTEIYDPDTDTWRRGDITLPWTSAGQGSCMIDDILFVFGGYSGDGISNHAACYDTRARKWSILPPMPHTLAAMGIGVVGRTIHLLGGWGDDRRQPQNFFWCYSF